MQTYLNRSTALNDILNLALREPVVRVRPILGPDGERLWLKRIEALSLRLRISKGDGRRAFANELRGLHTLADAGLPVPEILSEGPDHMVLSDVGATLNLLLGRPEATPGKRAAAFRAAGTALGRLHRAGFAHGSPAVRDICWDGRQVHFIDLERFSAGHASVRRKAIDVIVFVNSFLAETGRASDDLDGAMKAYRAAAPERSWANVQALCAWLGPLSHLTAPARWVMRNAAEVQAIPETMRYLRRAID